jgi:hypothetical protein
VRRFVGSGVIAVSLLLVSASTQAFAATTGNLLPTSAGNYQQWTPKSGANHVTMVDESSCNGTSDYNSETTLTQRDSYGISLSTVPNGATITQIAITPCASRHTTGGGSSTFNVFYRLNGVDSADAGAYALPSGTTPVGLTTTNYSSLSVVKSAGTTFEIGGVYSAGTKGVRLSQITTQLTYTPLSTPSALTAAASGSAVNLQWADNSSNEDGFKIERSDNGGAFNQIATVSANVNTYQDLSLATGTYAYRVRAYNSGGDTTYTSTATAYVLGTPSSLNAVATGPTVALTWTDNSTGEDGFRVEIATGAGAFGFYKTVGPNVQATNAVLPQNSYTFRVRAYKSTSNSDFSNTDSARVLSTPSSLTSTPTGSDLNLSWTDNAVGEDGYKVERSFNFGAFTEIASLSADSTSYPDTGLAEGNYSYRVRAYTSAGDASLNANLTTSFLIAPTGLTAVATGPIVALSWSDNSASESSYRIEIATGAAGFTSYKTVPANVTSTNSNNLPPNDYSFRVRAVSFSASEPSNTATATVLATPTDLEADVLGSDVTLTWTDNATGEDGYKVERADNGGGFVEIDSVAADETTYQDLGLASGSYLYRVRAYKGLDTSSYSSTASANLP